MHVANCRHFFSTVHPFAENLVCMKVAMHMTCISFIEIEINFCVHFRHLLPNIESQINLVCTVYSHWMKLHRIRMPNRQAVSTNIFYICRYLLVSFGFEMSWWINFNLTQCALALLAYVYSTFLAFMKKKTRGVDLFHSSIYRSGSCQLIISNYVGRLRRWFSLRQIVVVYKNSSTHTEFTKPSIFGTRAPIFPL